LPSSRRELFIPGGAFFGEWRAEKNPFKKKVILGLDYPQFDGFIKRFFLV